MRGPAQWAALLAGLTLVFALFQWTASTLGSDRGQYGLGVAILVVGATVAAECVLFRGSLTSSFHSLGLGVPSATALLLSTGIGVMLITAIPVFAWVAGSSIRLTPDWLLLLPGLFAQAGIAEEVLFRGFLFGHVRAGRSFWSAARLAMLPFVAVHLFLFFTMPWPIASAAVLLAVILSFPFAYLYEAGGATIWAPALLHFIIQGTIKVVVVEGGRSDVFPLFWMVASGLLPLVVLTTDLVSFSSRDGTTCGRSSTRCRP